LWAAIANALQPFTALTQLRISKLSVSPATVGKTIPGPNHPRPATLQTLSVDVPAALSELIMQLLQKDPVHRPASSQAVADTLAAIEHSLATPLGVVAPVLKP
jgi:hypothetical protein